MIQSAQYTVSSTPVQIYAGDGATTVHLHSATGSCYIGNSDVTTSNGFRIDNGDKLVIETHETSLYAVSSSSNTIYALVVTK